MGFLSSDKLIVGYDLGNEYCQISFATSETGEVETLSMVAGAQNYNIPTVLCKRYGANQWFYGKEAVRYAAEQQGILVENLLELALDGEPVLIEGESFQPAALLALFFKRSLGLLSQVGTPEKLTALMITCSTLDRGILDVLGQVVEGIHLKWDRVTFQSHTESFYNYMLHQPGELWGYRTVLFDYQKDCIRAYSMECNRRTTPVVAFIEERSYPLPTEENPDESFLRMAEETFGNNVVESVFLIGDGFSGDWLKESLRFLCRGRRVFQGNNLFSKGACHGMQERLSVSEAGKQHVFLGKDKLKANIGMRVMRRGEESYYALLDAGTNWYEAEQTTDIYIQDGNELALVITPLIGREVWEERIVLGDFPGNLTRLRLHLFLEEENRLAVEVSDLGFGEFRSSSGRTWREVIDIYERSR